MNDLDLDAILAFAIELALEAGQQILDGQAARFAATDTCEFTKTNSIDLVTDIDRAVEAYVSRRIKEAYPHHAFPIDGTTNFVHGYPMVATSIGFAVGGVPIVGVVYNPFLGMMYSAAKGRGAFLNRKTRLPITGNPRPLTDLGEALIHVDVGASRRAAVLKSRLNTFRQLAGERHEGGKMVHSLRSIGCASINMCLVASGSQDMHWEIGCWPWDVCAGLCILTEAGGAAFAGKSSDLCGTVDAKLLSGRKYLFIRAIATSDGQTSFEPQRRLCREFYDLTDDIDP